MLTSLTFPSRYDLPKRWGCFVSDKSPEEIEQRLRGGEWLSPNLIAPLFPVDPKKVREWTENGTVRFRWRSPGSKYKLCDPADVIALLDEHRKVHRAGDDT